MARWISRTQTVKLPKEKVQVNYIYVSKKGLGEVQTLLTETLTSYGKWDRKPIDVWLCSNEKEWSDSCMRVFEERPLMAVRASQFLTSFMLAYSPIEIQSLENFVIRKILHPNVLVRIDELSKMNSKEKKGVFKHEVLFHKLQQDSGFAVPLVKGAQKYEYSSVLPELISGLNSYSKDISANEIGVDLGFEDDVLEQSKYGVKSLLKGYSTIQKREKNPSNSFIALLALSSTPIPFDYGKKKKHAEKMRRFLYTRYGQLEIEGPIKLGRSLEKIFSGIKNPPQVHEVEKVYEGVIEKFEDFIQ